MGVTDSSMPRVDGGRPHEGSQKERAGNEDHDCYRSDRDSSAMTELETLGVFAIVSKPFAPSTVVSTLRTALT